MACAELMSYRLDDQVGFVLRQVSQRHTTIFARHIPDGLTPTRFSALVRLGELGPISQNALGRATAMDGATINGVVGRLERKGLVALGADDSDRRVTRVRLTDAGAALLDTLHRTGHTITDETLAPLSQDERERLLALLRRLA